MPPPSSLFQNLALPPLPIHTSSHPSSLPAFIYGTAWKAEKTADFVYQAISAGFRAVDTAAQPKHYREDLVGEGVRRAVGEVGGREKLWIQTKFTSIAGQDPNNLPYDPKLSIPEQVHSSIASSFHNLRPSASSASSDSTIIDCLVFHSPLPTTAQTLSAWRAAETYVPHRIRHLGISNISATELTKLHAAVTIKPAIVQNRFYAPTGYDAPLRRFCADRGIVYQAFWTLTANPQLVKREFVQVLSQRAGITPAQAFYGLLMGLDGVVVLNGTRSESHMVGDLDAVPKLRAWALENPDGWEGALSEFRKLVG